jgi:hypothetical protein
MKFIRGVKERFISGLENISLGLENGFNDNIDSSSTKNFSESRGFPYVIEYTLGYLHSLIPPKAYNLAVDLSLRRF